MLLNIFPRRNNENNLKIPLYKNKLSPKRIDQNRRSVTCWPHKFFKQYISVGENIRQFFITRWFKIYITLRFKVVIKKYIFIVLTFTGYCVKNYLNV